jgi:exodeoxyribonuclease I
VQGRDRLVRAGRPFLHLSGMYPAERGCLAVVWPLAPHPTNKNELIVWDLAQDPAELPALDAEMRLRLFTRRTSCPRARRGCRSRPSTSTSRRSSSPT